jgi:hypothetical protein
LTSKSQIDFNGPIFTVPEPGTSKFRTVDYDFDNDDDVLIKMINGSIGLLRNDNLIFTRDTLITGLNTIIPNSNSSIIDFRIADIDNDSDLDILVLLGSNDYLWNHICIYKNVNGIFQLDGNYQIQTGGRLEIMDIDNNGYLDIFHTGYSYEYINGAHIYSRNSGILYNTNGIFNNSINPFDSFGGQFAWGDIDGDLDEDLIIYQIDFNDHAGVHYFENEIGSFSYVGIDTIDVQYNDIKVMMSLEDFDLDGNMDLVISRSTKIEFLLGGGDFTFYSSIESASHNFALAGYYDNLQSYDYDFDGDADLLIMGKNCVNGACYLRAYVMKNLTVETGLFKFTLDHYDLYNRSSFSQGEQVKWADMDGDGAKDIILSGWSDQLPLNIFINNNHNPDWIPAMASDQIEISHEIYPNPTSNFVNFSESVESYNIKTIQGQSILLQSGGPANKIDLSELPNGVYLLEYSKESVMYSEKIIKK